MDGLINLLIYVRPRELYRTPVELLPHEAILLLHQSPPIPSAQPQIVLFPPCRSSQMIYQLPSTLAKRSCSFGYGTKIDFADRRKVLPPPGSYEPPTDFNPSKARHNTISFSMGRGEVKFGSFLSGAERMKTLPSPTTYSIKQTHYSQKGGRMAARLPSEIDLLRKKKVPGPGAYGLGITELKSSGSYILTRYRNNLSPKYLSPSNKSRSRSCSPTETIGPGQCTHSLTQMI